MERKPYYITTAIAYASGKPHIGNTYEIILADAMARFKRYEGYDVFFMTGTDEHGQKIEGKAKDAGKTPKEFVDEVVGEIRSIFDLMDTSYDKFMRTTEPCMKKGTFIRENMRAGIARPVSLSGQIRSLWTESVRTADVLWRRPVRTHTFSRCPSMPTV